MKKKSKFTKIKSWAEAEGFSWSDSSYGTTASIVVSTKSGHAFRICDRDCVNRHLRTGKNGSSVGGLHLSISIKNKVLSFSSLSIPYSSQAEIINRMKRELDKEPSYLF